MGKKKARNNSKLLDSGRDSVNIDINNGKLEKRDKTPMLNIVIVIFLILNLVLLHIILMKIKHLEEIEKRHAALEMALKLLADKLVKEKSA